MNVIKNLIQNEEGASAVEYGLMAALIAAVIVGAVTTLGSTINTMFTNLNGKIPAGS